jgi:hypothetical protein
MVSVSGSAAARLAELASSGAAVIGFVADVPRRAHLAEGGARLAEYSELERDPDLARGFAHVVLVDPPPSATLERLATLPGAEGGYLHPAWGELELRFALRALEAQLAQRGPLIAMFRDLRDAGEKLCGEELRAALRGPGPHPRGPEAAARCFRVLTELGLVQGEPERGDGVVGVVSSEGTELERSTAYLAYSARYQEGRQYLEGRKQT